MTFLFIVGASLASGLVAVTLAATVMAVRPSRIYVALADLIPAQRARMRLDQTLLDVLLVVAGIGVIALVAHGH